MILMALIATLGVAGLAYLWVLGRAAISSRQLGLHREAALLGAVTNFFDTLGIGSFAPTMAWMRVRRLVPDRQIPMTMVAGYTVPAIVQSAIFLVLLGVHVDPILLIGCIVAMVVGGIAGAPIVARISIRMVQVIVGVALLVAAFFYVLANLNGLPPGGRATGLEQPFLAIVIAAHFLLGILLNFGVGNYAPTLVILSLLGMDPRLAFPIMASAAAFALCASATRLVKVATLDLRIVVWLTLGSIPAVLLAAFIVKEMPLAMLRWLVVVVVVYAAITILYSASRKPTAMPPDEALKRALVD